ncbi:hypothetical protein DFA_00739 [Cavenderia fasciculata]|uniref:VPS9 domain-containing protein n=1 Tax=Cavenderia fasciculata TaxID=261658 RepID=F4PTJ2_CACFS|nr:uncharacterized protein DFA_00739 [Cavenderia fasciculata]EGG20874.1 hypothetical protein DFA_00739 [Cavenderia fasciculata]|eukprot:XP_004358724.1 hypothetical protein DFA_00739 [Cavenderia fasciculata]
MGLKQPQHQEEKKKSELDVGLFDQVGKLVTSSGGGSPSSSKENVVMSPSKTTSSSSSKTFSSATDFLDDLIDHSRHYSSLDLRQSNIPTAAIDDYTARQSNIKKSINNNNNNNSGSSSGGNAQDKELDSLLSDIDSLVVDLRGIEDGIRKSMMLEHPIDPPKSPQLSISSYRPTIVKQTPLSPQSNNNNNKLMSFSDPLATQKAGQDNIQLVDSTSISPGKRLLVSRDRLVISEDPEIVPISQEEDHRDRLDELTELDQLIKKDKEEDAQQGERLSRKQKLEKSKLFHMEQFEELEKLQRQRLSMSVQHQEQELQQSQQQEDKEIEELRQELQDVQNITNNNNNNDNNDNQAEIQDTNSDNNNDIEEEEEQTTTTPRSLEQDEEEEDLTTNSSGNSSSHSSTTTTPSTSPLITPSQTPDHCPGSPSLTSRGGLSSSASGWRVGSVTRMSNISPKTSPVSSGQTSPTGTLKNSSELKEKAWRKSNAWGLHSHNSTGQHNHHQQPQHPRSSTDPSSYFNRQSVVNIKPVDPNSDISGQKHRSTFPGVVSLPSTSPPPNVVGGTFATEKIVISSPILTSKTPSNSGHRTTVVFGERGLEYLNHQELTRSKSNYQKHQIHLDNPLKIKKLRDLLKNYNSKIIALINKISKERDDWEDLKSSFLSKYERRCRFFREDCQIDVLKSFRDYYSIKIFIIDLQISISDDRMSNLKQKLVDISYLARLVDDDVARKASVIYSTFFAKTLDLLNNGNVSLKLIKLKKLTEYEKKVRNNYKNAHLNYTSENVEKRERKLREIFSNAKQSLDFKSYYPWDDNLTIQSDYDKWLMDSRFMEGRQVNQLINVISEDCATIRKIKPIDIEDFIVQFCDNLIKSYNLPPTHSIFEVPTTHLIHQLTKRTVYPRIYSLVKIVLSKCGTIIKFDSEFSNKVSQLGNKSIQELSLVPTNFPEEYNWENNNPFEEAVAIINDLMFHVVPTDIVSTIQRCIASLHKVSIGIMESCKVQPKDNAFSRAVRNGTFLKVAPSFLSATTGSQFRSSPDIVDEDGASVDTLASSSTMSADDLFPLFIYVLIKSDIVGYSSLIISILENFSSELETTGEYGWCAVSFQAAISHLTNNY